MKLLSPKLRLLNLCLLALTSLIVVSMGQPSQDRGELPAKIVSVRQDRGVRPTLSSISGRVVDPKNIPVTGVEVRAPGRAVALTNRNGEFEIGSVVATERLPVSFTARGFIDTTRIYKVANSQRLTGNVVTLWPRSEGASLDAARGGKLKFKGGSISLPSNAVIDDRGRPVRNKVRVSLSVIDVTDRRQIRSVPGDFTARMRNKRIRQLETFGVFEVVVEGSDGRRAKLAPGKTATVELFIPRTLRRRAATVVGLFSFDKDTGLWMEQGVLRRTPGRTSYIAPVPNINTIWNADQPFDTTCLKLKILDENNQPAPVGTVVEAEGVDYTGVSPTVLVTDSTGEVCLLVKKCANVSVTAYHPSIGHIQSCPLEFSTHCYIASKLDCSNASLCPIETTTIQIAGGAFLDNLNFYDTARWDKANGWANPSPFDVCWLANNIPNPNGILSLQLNKSTCPSGHVRTYASGEYRTKTCYRYGTYEANFKAAAGDGLVTSFFIYTGPANGPQHHEIDVEIFGKSTDKLQANYYVGTTRYLNEIQLPFDAANGFHTYKVVWTANSIEWYVDNGSTPIFAVSSPVPSLPGKIMVNLWAADNSPAGLTLGTLNYQGPINADYDWIQYSP